MTLPSRGQQAYEDFCASQRAGRPWAAYPRWSDLTPGERDGWEASAGGTVPRRGRRVRVTAPQQILSAPVPELVRNYPQLSRNVQEDPVSPTAPAALAAIQQQAAALEADTHGNLLAVIITARHVGKAFTVAECVAVADFLAAIEAERRGQHQALAAYPVTGEPSPNGNGSRPTGPQAKAPLP